jgi:hypothetical protein
MPVTITGGISFTGNGVTMAGAPVATAAWFTAGGTTVQRITFETDTATPTVRGPFSTPFGGGSATSDLNYGWYAGGSGSPLSSIVNRITYASDTNTASVRGPLSSGRSYPAASGTDTYGWFGGGDGASGETSTVQRITYTTDTGTASVRGPLSYTSRNMVATGSSQYGWFAGGFAPGEARTVSDVSRITYATDTNTASNRGPLSTNKRGMGAVTDSTTYGWFGGGYRGINPPYVTTVVERITFATDTVATSGRGPLTAGRQLLAAAGNTTDGWFGGGYTNGGGGSRSTLDRITYASDTNTASLRGTLIAAANSISAAAGQQ